ncbi:GGDEF domain-containing protein [Fulvimonas yonginensis]|uniref:diguanylate cyclase n=1 Tax=Fulvimonas yonginensis TaxID=1495200 RepID=A0ABU8JF04_9GAMM
MRVQNWTPRIYPPLLLGHLGVLLWVGERRILACSYAFVLAILGFTVLLCWRRLRLSVRHNRPLWGLLLLSLAAQCAAFGLLLDDALRHPQGTLVAFDTTFYFCLSELALLIAAAYSPLTRVRRWTTGLDSVLACAIVALFYALLRQLLGGGATEATARTLMWMFDGIALFVALFATLRFVAVQRADERRFYFVLMAYAWAEALLPAIHNRFILSSESYLPELLLGLPFVLLGLLLSRRRKVWLRRYRPGRRTRRITASLRPLVLSLALCLLSFAELGQDRPLAIAALILAVVTYGTRTTVLLAYHLAVEEELRRLRRDLHHRSIHDELTGLLNRTGFRQVLRRTGQEAVRTRRGFGVAVVDVDNFKAFNDTYGHLAGDDCLSLVAHALRSEAARRAGVVAARYGGEEFVLLMSGAAADDAEAWTQQLREHVQSLQIRHLNAPLGVVTVSAGLALMPAGAALASEKLLRAADDALYEAKRAGRNQVRVAAVHVLPARLTA